jgi:hypothetical protein
VLPLLLLWRPWQQQQQDVQLLLLLGCPYLQQQLQLFGPWLLLLLQPLLHLAGHTPWPEASACMPLPLLLPLLPPQPLPLLVLQWLRTLLLVQGAAAA